MLENAIVCIVVALTTLGAYLISRKSNVVSFRTAVNRTLETLGASVLFLGLNMFLGTTLLVLARAGGYPNVSLYDLSDVAVVLLSAVQGLLFRFWRQSE
jgi:hypothetical protein